MDDLISRKAVLELRKYNLVGGIHTVNVADIEKLPTIPQTDSVLEDIKKELENMQEEYANIDDGRFWGISESLKIINKHISGKEKE